MKCMICRELYGRDSDMKVLDVRESILGLASIVTVGCEYCGFIGEVKVHNDFLKKLER